MPTEIITNKNAQFMPGSKQAKQWASQKKRQDTSCEMNKYMYHLFNTLVSTYSSHHLMKYSAHFISRIYLNSMLLLW